MRDKKLSSIIIWSVISAAFIGPGTVTTAVSAGSKFQLNLLWAVFFAVLACIVVQETAARITISSGLNLGQTFRLKFGNRWGIFFQFFIGWVVIAGCAAFEAGNLVGAVEGLTLIANINATVLAVTISAFALILLWLEKPYWISGLMLGLVSLMGIAFVVLAFSSHYSFMQMVGMGLSPSLPSGSGVIVLGLIGTTIVPYNIFLGSGISTGQTVYFMRIGLITSVILGGVVTGLILVAGTMVQSFLSFNDLMLSFKSEIGTSGAFALSAGLFGAGLSSSITAPYAASVIASTVFGWTKWRVVSVWLIVILSGLILSVSDFKPVQLIVTVQALNGMILPLLILFLILIVNDKKIIPQEHRPGIIYNLILITIFIIVVIISMVNIFRTLQEI